MKDAEWWQPAGRGLGYAVAALPDYLMQQRWFPMKDGGRPRVVVEQLIPLAVEGQRAALVLWQVSCANRETLRICLPIALVDERTAEGTAAPLGSAVVGSVPDSTDVLIDATALDSVVRGLVAGMVAAPGRSDRTGGIVKRAAETHLLYGNTPALESILGSGSAEGAAGSTPWPIRRSRVEQSNTSIRVGERAIFKLIRKLERGVHPELEMGRYLTERVHFEATPALLGWIDVGDTTVAVLQAFVANEGDGWTWLLERLRSDPTSAGLNWLYRLGERTGELHVALAADAADPAFAPEDIGQADWRTWKRGVVSMSQRAAHALQESADTQDDRTRLAAREYVGRVDRLDGILDGLLRDAGHLKKTRHHGDFHLGQVLVHEGDAAIVDFEGEPMRPLAERRAKHCALRDTAGMLRSLAYAAAVAGLADEQWLDAASDRFLDGYFERALSSPGCPPNRGAALRLVQFFAIEKALYEVLYELANRPTWVGIPLTALNRLLRAAALQRDDRTA